MKQSLTHATATRHLKRQDDVLGELIRRVGPCMLQKQGGTFQLLARSILSQQISTAAARTIRQRLMRQMPNGRISALRVVELTDDQFSAAGVSQQKRSYIRDLAHRVVDGRVNLRRLARADDNEVIAELTQVKGIGVWTAQMFLLFGLGRPDVFAPDDLGLQNAIKALYEKPKADRKKIESIAVKWAPYRSVASWYLWRSLDGT
ncbi:MAG: DNA-3-methyladenine glycosylase 2 family protein [Planctomycetales bacterium]|nr:DNA-3-methyladenine glycosylase 2 family protein [Planctomycetales bacterium]